MKTNFLLPHYFKPIGWLLLVPACLLGLLFLFTQFEFSFLTIKVLSLFPNKTGLDLSAIINGTSSTQNALFQIEENNFTDEFICILFTIAAIFVAFAKEKNEDEYISKVRLDSLVWATYVTYFIIIISILFLYDLAFGYAMIVNMFTLLIVFIIRFNFILFQLKKTSHEK